MSRGILGTFALAYGELTVEIPVNLSESRLGGEIKVGAFTYFNYGCEVGDSEIGRYCSVGQRVIISPGEHPSECLSTHPFTTDSTGFASGFGGNGAYARIACTAVSRSGLDSKNPVKIGHDVWIGARSVILRGTEIGHGAIVAAGAIVNRPIDPFAVVAGVPAKQIRWRFPEALRARLLELEWWDYDLSALGDDRDYSEIEVIVDRLSEMKSVGALARINPETVTLSA